MGTSNYSDEFKRDAVHQITVRGYPVREVSRRLGVSTHSLYKWMKLFGEPVAEAGRGPRSREPAAEARAGAGHRGARHPKKGNGVLRARVPMKYAFIRAHRERVRRSGHVPGAAGPFQRLLCMA